jgi:hypothetical protein
VLSYSGGGTGTKWYEKLWMYMNRMNQAHRRAHSCASGLGGMVVDGFCTRISSRRIFAATSAWDEGSWRSELREGQGRLTEIQQRRRPGKHLGVLLGLEQTERLHGSEIARDLEVAAVIEYKLAGGSGVMGASGARSAATGLVRI